MSQRNIQIQEQKHTQKQVQVQQMLPQQVMLVRLTEMPVEALQHRVELECMENPWLEASPDPSEGGENQGGATGGHTGGDNGGDDGGDNGGDDGGGDGPIGDAE